MTLVVPFTAGELLVAWHDVECGDYRADLPLWRELAAGCDGPVLDVGAGTGRVALDLARAGHAVRALDIEPVLLAELARRAAAEGLDVTTVVADAARLPAAERAMLIVVPMQTLQLLPSVDDFLAAARAALAPGGLLAAAIATELEPFSSESADLLEPDTGERDGWRFVSQPVAIADEGDHARIERLRYLIAPGGAVTAPEQDAIRLARLDPQGVLEAGARAGLEPLAPRRVPATAEHVGSEVVVLRG